MNNTNPLYLIEGQLGQAVSKSLTSRGYGKQAIQNVRDDLAGNLRALRKGTHPQNMLGKAWDASKPFTSGVKLATVNAGSGRIGYDGVQQFGKQVADFTQKKGFDSILLAKGVKPNQAAARGYRDNMAFMYKRGVI